MSHRPRRRRPAFTLVETVVVSLVVLVGAALLVPAVRSGCESSRRLRCARNLEQIGVALHRYAAAGGAFPPGTAGDYSMYAPLLGHLDQQSLANALNFAVPASGADNYGRDWFHAADPNRTVASTRLGVLNCPSDGGAPWEVPATNYAGNWGYGFEATPSRAAGIFDISGAAVEPARVADGLSSTVACSEWVVGAGTAGGPGRLGNIYHTRPIDDFGRFVAACDAGAGFADEMLPRGKLCLWLWSIPAAPLYNHNQGVNKLSCANGWWDWGRSSYSAASHHPGGANALFGDGSVRFVAETIAPAVWRALGSGAGGEVVPAGPY